MSRHSSEEPKDSFRNSFQAEHDADERKGLLSDSPRILDEDEVVQTAQPRKRNLPWAMLAAAGAVVTLIIVGMLYGEPILNTLTGSTPSDLEAESKPVVQFDATEIHTNGTHDFKKTAIIVSIDGLRADYLDRGLTPHLLAISKKGLRAKSMQPVFPTLTFPNHWAIMTGLHAESHGIVANNFWDPNSHMEFHYNSIKSAWNSSWWFGEPMWETAERAGIVSANLMWPGPPQTSSGAKPTYFIPWKDKVPLQEKLDQILAWIDLPLEQRPQFIMAYEPSLDQAGHLAGPASTLVNKTLVYVDTFARDLQLEIEARNLTHIVDIVFVSDHGMTDTSHPELIYVDDILGDNFKKIEHEDGWPSMGLRFAPDVNASHCLEILRQASFACGGKFDVYTPETMPERYHFANNDRIAPIYVIPKEGYELTNWVENGTGMSKGNHGYDNANPSMHAMFVAHGPFSSVVKTIESSKQSRSLLPRFLKRPNKGWHSTANDVYVMDTFNNVELYNLMMKLLGIESHAAPTNGTAGFWDKYF